MRIVASNPQAKRTMFVLVQIDPDEPAGDDGLPPLTVVAVDVSEARLEAFLSGYRERYDAATREWDAWDETTRDEEWGPRHDAMFNRIKDKHQVYGLLGRETKFAIIESETPL